MRTIEYELKGKEVPASLQGRVIRIRTAESDADIGEGKVFASADAMREKANDGYVISVQGLLRNRAANALKGENGTTLTPDEAAAKLQTFADGYTYNVRQEGQGGPSKPKTPAGIAKSKASSAGNRLFEKCASDEAFLARMVKQGIVDADEFTEWQTARAAAVTAAGENHGEK